MADAAELLQGRDPHAITNVSTETQLAVERFLYRQAEFLDEKQWDQWLALYMENGFYWMPAEEDQTEGDGQPNIFWEDQDLMRMRIDRNTHPRAHSQAPHNRLCHVVSNVVVESEEANGDLIVRSRFHCAEYLRYEVRNFTGKYRHYLNKTPDGYRIGLQRVDLVNREGPYDYVLQWWL
jgi:3-phenylpropionate/cinnamic acid dioxygenase small subunit